MLDSSQHRPQSETDAGHSHSVDGGDAPLVREFHMSRGERVGNTIVSVLARVGIGPFQLLTTRGRKTGRPHTTPVTLVKEGGMNWLVAPYGAVSWVHNARAAGQVTLRRGRETPRDYAIRELRPDLAGPVLKRYIDIASATRPYFQAQRGSPAADFIAEAHRHPVFELTPLGKDEPPSWPSASLVSASLHCLVHMLLSVDPAMVKAGFSPGTPTRFIGGFNDRDGTSASHQIDR